MEPTIQELVALCKQDMIYTQMLWERFRPLCLKWVSKFDKEQEDIEGLYQETYLIMLKALKDYDVDQKKNFESYFKIVLYRWGYNYQHKKKEQLVLSKEEGENLENQIDERACTEAQGMLNLQIAKLDIALQALNQDDYELIIALYVKGERIKAISEQYGVSYIAIESRKRRILKKIKKFFDGL